MPAVVLSPGKLPIQESLVHRRHFRGPVVPFLKTRDAKKLIDAARVHGRHKTSLVVEPPGIALRRDTVADEGEARGAKSDERIAELSTSPIRSLAMTGVKPIRS